ncbi:hypothetical protein HZB01_04010 [Candidatus Woesearchaeota archaeon]|nr:hypothetical protein [Candidatus Woesearchaeota archaeon]
MSEVKTIKIANEQTWVELKSLAAQSKKNMGDFLDDTIRAYKRENARRFWDNLLNVTDPISDEEAERMREIIRKNRVGGFREIPWH